MDGLIVRYREDRGFGFLRPLNGNNPPLPDIFFHRSALVGVSSVPVGARCKFIIVDGKGGKMQAAQVRLLQLSGRDFKATPLRH